MANPILVEVTRGPLVESVHRGSIAIANAEGEIVFSLGDIEALIYPRSSLKPIQALPLIESGAAEAFGLSDEEIALACASHSGEPMHTDARGGLARAHRLRASPISPAGRRRSATNLSGMR